MDKQKEILTAALRLFVEYGFHGTPTSKIASEAGVANGTLFHYYKTKEELILALYVDIKAKMNNHMASQIQGNDIQSTFKIMFIHSIYWALDNKTEFRFIQQFHTSPFQLLTPQDDITKQTQHHLELIIKGIESNIIKPLPPELIYTLVTSHVFGVFEYLTTINATSEKTKEIIIDTFEMFWKMIT